MDQKIKYTLEDAKLDLYGVQLISNSAKDSDRTRKEIEFIFAKLSGDAELIDCPICDATGYTNAWPAIQCLSCKGTTKVYEQEWIPEFKRRRNELP